MDNEKDIKLLLKAGMVYCKVDEYGISANVHLKLKLVKHIGTKVYFTASSTKRVYKIFMDSKYFIEFKTEEEAKNTLKLISNAWSKL